MKLRLMNGAGNTFAVFDARGLTLDFADLAKRLCKPTGVDGLLAIDHSQTADFKLHFYNPDGLRGEMCGNGARCVCRFAFDLGIVESSMTIETDAGLVFGQRIRKSLYRVQLNLPSVLDLQRTEAAAYVELGNPGIPHCVTEIPDLSWDDREKLRDLAQKLRFDPAFPKGVNVNFYNWVDSSTVRLLTYERGVEDYTLACGTGSASTAVTLWAKGLLKDGSLTVKNPGGDLAVTIQSEAGQLTALFLEGPAEGEKWIDI